MCATPSTTCPRRATGRSSRVTYGGVACAVLLVVLYWANLYMWVQNVPLDGKTYANVWHVVRLLIQLAAIATCLFIAGELRTTSNG